VTIQEAVRHVEDEVRELIRRSGIDPVRDGSDIRRLVMDAVQDYDERSLHGGLPILGDPKEAVHSILSIVAGYGPLQQYFDDPAVEEIWVNGPDMSC
jgi:pilus assembly protein CpaF